MGNERQSKCLTHADRELDILLRLHPDAVVKDFIPEIKALVNKFGNSGQAGGSAPYVAGAIVGVIKSLLAYQPVCDLTGEDSEWFDVSGYSEDNTPTFQNNRDGRVFKNKDGKAYFIEAIVFEGDKGGTFTTNGSVTHNGEKISSTQYIKSFPFTPKTFRVDVIDYRWKDKDETTPDENGDWWTHTIKDEKQLEEVFQYFDKMIR
jgi:hypothetical protein